MNLRLSPDIQSNRVAGTEAETIPLAALAGTTKPLTVPNAATYYHWSGAATSAQYYLNNKGVSTQVGCQWGNGKAPVGNWAPLNIGAGQTSAGKFLGMLPNSPTTDVPLNYNVKMVGDNLSADCKYENGQFYLNGVSTPTGCTVSCSLLLFGSGTDASSPNRSGSCPATPTSFSTSGLAVTVGAGTRETRLSCSSVHIITICYLQGCLLLCILSFVLRCHVTRGREFQSLLHFYYSLPISDPPSSLVFPKEAPLWLDLLLYFNFKTTLIPSLSIGPFLIWFVMEFCQTLSVT